MRVTIGDGSFAAQMLESQRQRSLMFPLAEVDGLKLRVAAQTQDEHDYLAETATGKPCIVDGDGRSWTVWSSQMLQSKFTNGDFVDATFTVHLVQAETLPTFTEIEVNDDLMLPVAKYKTHRFSDSDTHSFLLPLSTEQSAKLTELLLDGGDHLRIKRVGADESAWSARTGVCCVWSESKTGGVHRLLRVMAQPDQSTESFASVRLFNLEYEVARLTRQVSALLATVAELSGGKAVPEGPRAVDYWDRLEKVRDADAAYELLD